MESLLASIVQTLDNAIHRINHYPADKYYRNQLRYPLDSAIQRLNNRGLKTTMLCFLGDYAHMSNN